MKKTLITLSLFIAMSAISMSAQDIIVTEKTVQKIEKLKVKGEKKKESLDKDLEKNIEKIKQKAEKNIESVKQKAEKDIEKAKQKNLEGKIRIDSDVQKEIEIIRLKENVEL